MTIGELLKAKTIKTKDVIQKTESIKGDIEIEFYPKDERVFKNRLLQNRSAKMTFFYEKSKRNDKLVINNNFSEETDLMEYIRSSLDYWINTNKNTGLVKVLFSIEDSQLEKQVKIDIRKQDAIRKLQDDSDNKSKKASPAIENKNEIVANEKEPQVQKQKHSIDVDKFSDFVKEKFLSEKVGYSCSIADLEEQYFCNSKYEFQHDDIESGLAIANKSLIDIVLYFTASNTIYSSKRYFEISKSPTGESQCYICENYFSREELLNHILNEHTTDKEHCSILTKTGNVYYCHHCRKRDLRMNKLEFAVHHLKGDCKKGHFFVLHPAAMAVHSFASSKICSTNTAANTNTFLGNTGQIFRDNGKFGSMPEEDYHGGGDDE